MSKLSDSFPKPPATDDELHDFVRASGQAEYMHVLRFIDDHKEDINRLSERRDMTALMEAAWRGRRDMVGMLLKNGAVVNQRNDAGKTELMMAAWQGHADI